MPMRCTVCAFSQVSEVDVLLSTGTSIRSVSRLYGLSRSSVGRHRAHVVPTSTPFGVIPGGDGSPGTSDPLSEAFLLAERARTPRQRIRALEQVREATRLRLRLRGMEDLDADDRALLENNVRAAERAFRDAADFETAARALSGWRAAILHRLDAVRTPDGIPMQMRVAFTDLDGDAAAPVGDQKQPATFIMPLSIYFAGAPRRYRDIDRFTIARTIHLAWEGSGSETLRVYDIASGALVWAAP
jgi:hypothetical protein